MSLPGLTAADTIAMAAAFYASKISNSEIDWDKATILMGSKSIAGARERVRLAKKKVAGIDVTTAATALTKSSGGPVGGIDKKSPTKVKAGPKKANRAKPTETKVKDESPAAEDGTLDDSIDDEV